MTPKQNNLSSAFQNAESVPQYDTSPIKTLAYFSIVVFGFIVTASMYVASQKLAQPVIETRLEALSETTTRSYLNSIAFYANSMNEIGNEIKSLDEDEIDEIKSNKAAYSILDGVRPFNFIALFEESGKTGDFYLLDRKVKDPDLSTLQAMALHKNKFYRLLKKSYAKGDNIQLLLDSTLLEKLNHISGKTGDGKVVFIKKIQNRRGTSWLVAEDKVTNVFLQNSLIVNDTIASVLLLDPKTNQDLYYYTNNNTDINSSFFPEVIKTVSYGGQELVLKMLFVKSTFDNLLEKTPFIALVFGGVFTLLAAIYSFLQVSQEKRIKFINHVLKNKNKALEEEMIRRERLSEDMKKSEEENTSLLNSISDIVFEVDSKANIVFLNESWTTTTGFEIEKAIGRNLINMLDPEHAEDQKKQFEKFVFENQKSYVTETRLRTIDGNFRSIELKLSIIRRNDKGEIRAVGRMSDIEEKKRTATALIEAEKQYQEIVRNAAWGMYQMTAEGAYISANPAMARILGYDKVEDVLNGVTNAMTQIYNSSPEQSRFLREVENVGVTHSHEIEIMTKQNQKIWIHEHMRAVKDDSGHIVYFEGSVENITKRKQADIAFQEAKKNSDAANRAKTEFLANMSHELRTPLNAIIGFSEILSSQTLGSLGHESYKEYSDEIHNGGKRLLHIINEILEISKIEVNKRELNESQLLVNDCIDYSVDRFGAQAKLREITVVNEVKHPQMIVAEERALKQVFSNILSNGIKFTPQGGSVTIRSEIASDGGFNISFADTGIGLDFDEIQKALSPFGQVDASLDQVNTGTGLGLTLVKSLVELHNGRLDVFSQKGMGTTVTVCWPPERVIQTTS